MADIEIRHAHELTDAELREKMNALMGKLQARFGGECHWQGNCAHYDRSGIDARITCGEREVRVTVKLGLMMLALRGVIESEIRGSLDKYLG
ncbi:MAG: polyhydroxyalkanoic acid system family protein [Porticoccaceae bacterium]